MEKILIIGGGGHAKVLISLIKKKTDFDIIGYTDIENHGAILGVCYLGKDIQLDDWFKKGIQYAAIGIGQIQNVEARKNIVQNIETAGFKFPSIISPHAVVNEDVTIGEGTVVMDGVVINPGSRIGKFCIINTNASIDHDCFIGDFVHIAPGATLSGGVTIASECLIGAGSTIIEKCNIPGNSVVGAGAVAIGDLTEPGTYWGVPASKKK